MGSISVFLHLKTERGMLKMKKSFVEELREARGKAKLPISKLREAMTAELRKCLDEFYSISRRLNVVELITPINATSEKTKFLSGTIKDAKDPAFVYDEAKLAAASEAMGEIQIIHEKLLKIEMDDEDYHFLWGMLYGKTTVAGTTARIARSILEKDDELTSDSLCTKFGWLDDDWAEKATTEYDRIRSGAPADHNQAPHVLRFLSDQEIDYLLCATYDAPLLYEPPPPDEPP